MLPEQFRLLAGFDPSDHPVLHTENIADVMQQFFAAGATSSLVAQRRRERLNTIENVGDAAFVMRQHQALRQNIGDQLQPLDRAFPQYDVSRGIDILLALRIYQDLRLLPAPGAGSARSPAAAALQQNDRWLPARRQI